jgi:class 3 adenylate cyclase/CHASE2 domain-containing sensor protein
MSQDAGKSRFPRNFSIAFTAVFCLFYWPGILGLPIDGAFRHAEDVWADKVFQLRENSLRDGDPRIILIALDVDTGKKLSFPLPRIHQARLLDKFKAYGVRTAVFDVLFHEPREGDKELIAATKRFGRAIHLFDYETKVTDGPNRAEVTTVNEPIKGLKAASQYMGFPNVQDVLDQDGHLRRAKLFEERTQDPKDDKRPALSMAVAAVASFTGKDVSEFVKEFADPTPRILLLNFRRPKEWLQHKKRDQKKYEGGDLNLPTVFSPYQMISALDILGGELTPQQKKDLKGSIVIVGSTALGYFDHYPSPFFASVPGFEVHANAMDNLLNGDFMGDAPRFLVLLVILVMIWLPVLLRSLPPAAGSAIAAGVLAGWFAFSFYQAGRNVRLETIAPAVALLISFLVQTVHRVLTEGQEKKFIKNLFGQFVAPEVVEKLANNPALVKLGGEKRDMTMFFLDIAHFTTISEKMAPEALIIFLNKYLSALSHIVHEQQGVVDKYIGDCIMAFWNAPMDLKDHRAKACLAAIECQEMMKELNKDLDSTLPETPAIRIGLNSGEVTVGLTGSEKKLQYTVIGDEVNLASRLEGANKFFGSHIMASEATYAGAKDVVEARELGQVRVVGKAVPIRVYELLAKKGKLSPEWQKALPLYNKGIENFSKGAYAEAMTAFEEVIKIFPNDGPSFFYLNTSRDYSVLPPDNWDGVINLTAK